jgi:hypothetical protein
MTKVSQRSHDQRRGLDFCRTTESERRELVSYAFCVDIYANGVNGQPQEEGGPPTRASRKKC